MGRRGALLVGALLSAVQGQLILTSPAFEKFQAIPKQYNCDEVLRDPYRPSIPLTWYRPPSTTQSFVLLMDDMDADGMVQWLVKDIPSGVDSLGDEASEINMPSGSIELTNSHGFDSYTGPCPPGEEHSYRVRLFAMPTTKTVIELPADPYTLRAQDIVSQIEDQALISAVLIGKAFVAVPKEGDTITINPQVNAHRNKTLNKGGNRKDFSQDVATTRIIKPSEVYKSKKADAAVDVPEDCTDVKPDGLSVAECIIKHAKAAAFKAQQQALLQTTAKASTAELVRERVERFRHDMDSWSCESEYRRRKGQRLVHGNATECPLRVRVTDAQCSDKAMWPRQFVCGGNDGAHNESLSPSISWTGVPEGTQSFVLMVEESSAPPFVQDYGRIFWLVTDVPPTTTAVDAAASRTPDMPPLAFELRNSFGKTSYTPPCPGPHEVREYRVRAFAMPHQRTRLTIPSDARAGAVASMLQKEALCMATVELPFSYKKAPVTSTHNTHTAAPIDTAGETAVLAADAEM